MKLLSSEVRNLLEKLYNLRGEDSVILKKMTEEREEAIETQERTKNEKTVLIVEIEKLTEEEQKLADEGNKLMDVLSSINKNDFETVLNRLNIDFDPDIINAKVAKLLPETIDKVVSANKEATEKLENVEVEMNNAITKVEELGIRKDEALSNQARLNEYFDLALKGNINITRDELTNLLEKFDFTENEQREAAKILMFPEDALYEFDSSYKNGDKTPNKTITDVLIEAKKESISKEEVETPVANNKVVEEVKPTIIDVNNNSSIGSAFEQAIAKNVGTKPNSINISSEIKPEKSEKEKLEEVLTNIGFDPADLSAQGFAKVLENYDPVTIVLNVQTLKDNKIDLKILKDNVELFYDKELKEKIDRLLKIGKEAYDICLVPGVLVKYDLKGLNNTINVLQISGLDPKKVPLMAY